MQPAVTCPNCHSDKTRRGGNLIWTIYVALVAVALLAVLVFHLNAAIVGAIMIGVVVIAHLTVNQRVCVDCGNQWRARGAGDGAQE
jgi:predicted lysophospholipase L1 biosynthesis ABC-type transport system permease subunit